MRALCIRTGFHRIGLSLAVPFLTVAAVSAVEAASLVNFRSIEWALMAAVAATIGATVYGVALALGWIIAGFVGESEI
jgi:hypothetical protein